MNLRKLDWSLNRTISFGSKRGKNEILDEAEAVFESQFSHTWKSPVYNEKRGGEVERRIIMQICSGSGFSRTVECLSVSRLEGKHVITISASAAHRIVSFRESGNKENNLG